ncbi:MAG TPA: peptide-methionine (S)-S-oxide reductase MsrA [Candidatus Paceibacterota bacterium]|nr:peptide-methionine (S)-S-oxide reductase MsrA [Candidatus Paceibacterota bacterium]
MENNTNKQSIAVFGGGCFWCTEAVFKMMKGVQSVVPGYAGGTTPHPTYEQVCGGNTGHVEVVRVEYDPALVKYEDLLTVFFGSHDPTTPNRQGNDIGTQYRSVVFYTSPEQREAAEKFIKEANMSNKMGAPIVTTVEPLTTFYEAEDYHKDYYAQHKNAGYCVAVINPKLEKVQHKYAELLQDIYRK